MKGTKYLIHHHQTRLGDPGHPAHAEEDAAKLSVWGHWLGRARATRPTICMARRTPTPRAYSNLHVHSSVERTRVAFTGGGRGQIGEQHPRETRTAVLVPRRGLSATAATKCRGHVMAKLCVHTFVALPTARTFGTAAKKELHDNLPHKVKAHAVFGGSILTVVAVTTCRQQPL